LTGTDSLKSKKKTPVGLPMATLGFVSVIQCAYVCMHLLASSIDDLLLVDVIISTMRQAYQTQL